MKLVRLAALAILSAIPPVSGVAQEAPQRSMTQLSENVWRAQNDIHFTVFMVTPEGIVLADPISREFSTWLKGELERRFAVPVRYVVYSHHHWDHASGGAVFADTAQFVGHENMTAHLEPGPADMPLPAEESGQDLDGDGAIGRSEARGRLLASFVLYDADGNGVLSGAEVARGPLGDVRPPDITYADVKTISLGGRTVEMTWTGPITHTDDMSVIRFPDEEVIFVVDFLSIETMPYRTLGADLLPEWLAAIRAVEAMDFDIVAPGHGVVGDRADVAAHRHYLEDLRAAVAAGIEAGSSVARMQQEIHLTEYSDWFMYDAWRVENIAGMYRLLGGVD